MKSGPFHLPKCTFFIYLFSFLAIVIFNYSCQDKSLAESEDLEFNVIEFEPISVNKTIKMPVYAHYMPWFQTPEFSGYWGNHWTMANKNPEEFINGQRSIASHYYPLIGPYDSNDEHYLEYALVCMKLSGIDGILIDFYGQSQFNDYPQLLVASNAVIEMCEKVGLDFAIVYEDRTIKSILDQSYGNKVGLAKEDLLYTMEQCHRLNITTRSMYFVGYPTESEDEFKDTLDTIEKLKPYDEILKPLYIGVLMRVKPNTRAKTDYTEKGFLKKDKRFPNNFPYRMYWVYDDGKVLNDLPTRIDRHKRLAKKCKDLKFKYFDDPLQFEIGKLEENVAKYVST